MTCLGLDIGGANLKAADCQGHSVQRPFAVWKHPELLADELKRLLGCFSVPQCIAITMTAELADCYRTKAEGIRHILEAVLAAAGSIPTVAWSLEGKLLSISKPIDHLMLLAASNWHALASWLARGIPAEQFLLIDIGSTTTDIIPVANGKILARGSTDFERLAHRELVYTGIRRTPVCAVTNAVQVGAQTVPVAAEIFATMYDVYLLSGELQEDAFDCDTANGRPAIRDEAYDRLVRQVCCDRTEISLHTALQMAQDIATRQEQTLGRSIDQVLDQLSESFRCQSVILSGTGQFLARRVIDGHPAFQHCRVVDICDYLAPARPEAACAYAVAHLARIQMQGANSQSRRDSSSAGMH